MKTVIWTNGCFDIIHEGHLALFKYASSLGDKLLVGIDTDRRVKERKGDSRPINNQNDRFINMMALPVVNNVFIFDSDTELRKLIKSLEVDIMVVGDDYKDQEVIGSEHADDVKFFTKIAGYSTTEIINGHSKIQR